MNWYQSDGIRQLQMAGSVEGYLQDPVLRPNSNSVLTCKYLPLLLVIKFSVSPGKK